MALKAGMTLLRISVIDREKCVGPSCKKDGRGS
jgi:hypothetical protein